MGWWVGGEEGGGCILILIINDMKKEGCSLLVCVWCGLMLCLKWMVDVDLELDGLICGFGIDVG